MYHKTKALLAGSTISPQTHPVLVSLLEMAAQGPGVASKDFADSVSMAAFRQRVLRSWNLVRRAFFAASHVGVTDERLLAVCPFDGISFSQADGWKMEKMYAETYRARVAGLLERAAGIEKALSQVPAGLLPEVLSASKAAVKGCLRFKRALLRAGYREHANVLADQVNSLKKLRKQIRNENHVKGR